MPTSIEDRTVHLEVIQGDSFIRTGNVDDENGDAQAITGGSMIFTIRRDLDATDDTGAAVQKTLGDGISVIDDGDGEFQITCSATDMSALTFGEYWYDLQFTPPAGSIVRTLQIGRFRVVKAPTKTVPA